MPLPRIAFVVFSVAAACVLAPVEARQADTPLYTHVATLPSIVDGQPLRSLVFDPVGNRLYAGSDRGLFWADLGAAEPRLVGPVVRADITKIEVAPDLGRVFFSTDQEIAYIDARAPGEPTVLRPGFRAWDMAYEPSRQELYIASRDSFVEVYDARSGERGARIPVPGWYATSLEAIPGKMFLSVGSKDGLYVIDAATHRIAPWPVKGRVVTPAYVDADPAGQHLFLTYSRDVVAVDVAKAEVVGRIVTATPPAIAYDPASRLLLVTWEDDPPPTRVAAYKVDENGLSLVARLKNPTVGRVGLEPMNRGFIQNGVRTLLVWSFTGPADAR